MLTVPVNRLVIAGCIAALAAATACSSPNDRRAGDDVPYEDPAPDDNQCCNGDAECESFDVNSVLTECQAAQDCIDYGYGDDAGTCPVLSLEEQELCDCAGEEEEYFDDGSAITEDIQCQDFTDQPCNPCDDGGMCPECTEDADCPSDLPRCETEVCVQCTVDADCGSGEVCLAYACTYEGDADAGVEDPIEEPIYEDPDAGVAEPVEEPVYEYGDGGMAAPSRNNPMANVERSIVAVPALTAAGKIILKILSLIWKAKGAIAKLAALLPKVRQSARVAKKAWSAWKKNKTAANLARARKLSGYFLLQAAEALALIEIAITALKAAVAELKANPDLDPDGAKAKELQGEIDKIKQQLQELQQDLNDVQQENQNAGGNCE